MAVIQLTAVARAVVGITESFEIADLLRQAGYASGSAFRIQSIVGSSGGTAPVTALDADTLRWSAGAVGSSTVVVQAGADTIELKLDVTIASGTTMAGAADAGLVQPMTGSAALGDRVWNDADGDGLQGEDEVGVAGVRVTLQGGGDDGILGTPDDTTKSTLTDADGFYTFSGLRADVDYRVRFSNLPAGFSFTKADEGFDDLIDSDADATGFTQIVVLSQGEVNLGLDAGVRMRTASLGDRVWLDANGNGQQDQGENGVGGVTATLQGAGADGVFGTGDDVVRTATTNDQGLYGFTNLTPSQKYRVQFSGLPAGYAFTGRNLAADDVDSDVNSAGLSHTVTLAPGQSNMTVDAGLVMKKASLGDFVWFDADADGVQDTGETGVSGIGVRLIGAGLDGTFGTADDVSRSTTTDLNGNYLFNNLDANQRYRIQVDALPDGFAFTRRDATAEARDSDVDASGLSNIVTLAPGQFNRNVDAGIVRNVEKARIGDTVFEDKDADGVQDADEDGVEGATVLLKDAGGNVIASVVTGIDGKYSFTVDPGTYQVAVQAPAGYVVSPKDRGGDDAADSDIDPLTLHTGPITVGSGQVDNSNDAGLYREARLGNRVWLDTDGNGVQDGGELGVADVTVLLKNAAGDVVGQTQTDALGEYVFEGLVPGTYSVQFVAPDGYVFTQANQGGDADDSDADRTTGDTATTTLRSGGEDLTLDAGLVQRARIGDRVFEDKDADGVQDDGEVGIADVVVKLKDAAGNVVQETRTDGSGNYHFDVLPGAYQVAVEAPSGYQVSPRDQGDDSTDSDIDDSGHTGLVTVPSGAVVDTVDAGLFRYASLGNRIWYDDNYNGIQDGDERGVAGVRLDLIGAGVTVVASTTTDENGLYVFDNLMPGTYFVDVDEATLPTGYQFTLPDAGLDDELDSDVTETPDYPRSYGLMQVTVLESGESDMSWDAGIVAPARIGDRVFEDLDADGVQDDGEQGIADVVVKLEDAAGNVVAETRTDAAGYYQFDTLPGSYRVAVEAPVGYHVTLQDRGGDDAADSDIDANGRTGLYDLRSNQTIDTADAGLYRKASIGDRIWFDRNANGVQDDGETGVAGVRVELKDASRGDDGNLIAATVTDADGFYRFNNLTPGAYHIDIDETTLPAGAVFTTPNAGGDDAADSDVRETATYPRSWGKMEPTVLESGEVDLTWDAGIVIPKARIGDRVFEDKDADGVQDDGESGIANVVVKLKDLAGNVVAETRTDGAGLYRFDVNPGSYRVAVEAPSGYFVSPQDRGGNDATDSDIDGTGHTGTYTLTAGQVVDTADAGLYRKAVIGDRVWFDNNANGVQDDGEAGVAAVKVELRGADGGVVATTTTDANGYYSFTVNPGLYNVDIVESTLPAGYVFTLPNVGSDDGRDSDVRETASIPRSWGTMEQTLLESGESDLSWDAGIAKYKQCLTIDFNGNTALDGTDGNIRTYSQSGVTVNVSGFSRDSKGVWAKAYVGAYEGGLGVTDSGEGNGSGDSHTVDNLDRDNYVVFRFSESVVVNRALLDYVIGDSDIQIWVGTVTTPMSTAVQLSDALLSGAFTEMNNTDQSGIRWADFNAGELAGNVFVLAADPGDTTPEDRFKIHKLDFCTQGLAQPKGTLGNFVFEDLDYDGVQDGDEKGIANVTVRLLNSANEVVATTTTDSTGKYQFETYAGDYKVQVATPSGYFITKQNVGDDNLDSDVDASGTTGTITQAIGEHDSSVDIGLWRKARIGDRVWEDKDHDSIQDVGEPGIKGIKVMLQNSSGSTIATTTTDSNGNYAFGDLTPGSYRVAFDKSGVWYYSGGWYYMNNWYWTKADIGSDDNVDGDAYSTSNVAYTGYTQLTSGENDNSWDVGITPIVIDLNGDGVQTVALGAAGGTFDLLGTGQAVASGWLSGSDGFLAVDANGNGRVDSIAELFGGTSRGDGFAKLASFDSNGDGLVDLADAAFAELRIWRDADGNHQTDAGELMSLADAGVAALTVAYTDLPFMDQAGNLHLERSSATMADGTVADMTDVYFAVGAADAQAAGISLPNLGDLLASGSLDEVVGAAGEGASSASGADAADATAALARIAALMRDETTMAQAA